MAELFVYPCAVRVPDGTFPVNTPEELLEYYGEALEDHMGDLIPKLDYTTLFTRNGLVGVGDGAAWFGLVEDGEIRLFSLWPGPGRGSHSQRTHTGIEIGRGPMGLFLFVHVCATLVLSTSRRWI